MIAKLKGRVETIGVDHVLVDVNGVCYQVFTSVKTLTQIGCVGDPVVLFTEMMTRNELREHAARGTQCRKRADLVGLHHAAIARGVGGEDSGQFALNVGHRTGFSLMRRGSLDLSARDTSDRRLPAGIGSSCLLA